MTNDKWKMENGKWKIRHYRASTASGGTVILLLHAASRMRYRFGRNADGGEKGAGTDTGGRRGQAAASTHQAESQACCSVGRQVPFDRHPRFKLHQLGHTSHLDTDAIQLGVAQPAHRANLSLQPFHQRLR